MLDGDLYVNKLQCCGVHELDGIADASSADVVDQVCREFNNKYHFQDTVFPAFILFSEAGKRGGNYGRSLAKYIMDHDLGLVTRSDRRKNPNTGNLVRVYLWAVAHGRMLKRKGLVERRDERRDQKERDKEEHASLY